MCDTANTKKLGYIMDYIGESNVLVLYSYNNAHKLNDPREC